MTTSPITFDVAAFRVRFPEFQNTGTYPDALLQAYFTSACNIISADYTGCDYLNGDARADALYLLTAHLAKLGALIAAGEVPALMKSAGIDKVNVSIEPPPVKTQFQWWLSLTGYGQQLLALLMVKGVGGFMAGGLPERSAFRKVGGIF